MLEQVLALGDPGDGLNVDGMQGEQRRHHEAAAAAAGRPPHTQNSSTAFNACNARLVA